MSDSFRYYTVIETKDMDANELQDILNQATNDLPERQIDFAVGTKLILGHESLLNAKGRAEARNEKQTETTLNEVSKHSQLVIQVAKGLKS